ASLAEYLDMVLLDPPGESDMLARLNAATAEGLRFLGARHLGAEDPKLSLVVDEAEYVVGLAAESLNELGGAAELQRRLRAFGEATSLPIRRDIKGLGKMIDVKHFVREI